MLNMKNLHPTDREALLGLTVLIGAVVLLTSSVWFHAIITGQC